MTNAARGNASERAEPGEEPSASSARGENTTSDGRRVHLAETEVGTSLTSSRTMPAWILDSPKNPLLWRRAPLPLVGIVRGSSGGEDGWGRKVGGRFPP